MLFVSLQLCVSDGVEDLMEGMSLTVETEKSPSSQGPEGQLGGDVLLGETGGVMRRSHEAFPSEMLNCTDCCLSRGPQTRLARRAPRLGRTWRRVQV